MNALEIMPTTMNQIYHYPVMYREILTLLNLSEKKVVVDCTVGVGSHALRMLEAMKSDALFIGIDRDEDSLSQACAKLQIFGKRVILIKSDFSNIDSVLLNLHIAKADAFIFDLGISTYQLSESNRGFSFSKEGPLDMRMDKNSFVCAADLVNNLSEIELENIFRKFGEERYAYRIARAITDMRRREPIVTTTQLAEIILRATPLKVRDWRLHPATRVFQALRIAVNRELEALKAGIDKAVTLLNAGGRIAVISFHSLEDRIVKHTLRDFSHKGVLKIITKKPIIAGEQELLENNPSRSAKLRVAEKI
ncbi:MAG: 16S rRNA (cytosine(1402)-N(4))-methyltransferase RsmH [Candidatus Omnitrophica bacterium]|nr:16S rRNA (cytosine(1402)-N(4))-methyltransferase RsmH [Candidatus Omnitrophota bacterium]